jgi:drug/metabolite transporter (DMT)-like permease
MQPTTRQAYLIMHFCVLMWGLTAPLGKLIEMDAINLVGTRMVLTALSFVPLVWLTKSWKPLPAKTYWKLVGIGFLVAAHWVTFYGSIKLSNASVALVGLATTSLFTSFIEPFFNRKMPQWQQILPAFLVIPGIALIASDLRLDMLNGLWLGLITAVLCSIFGVLNKQQSNAASPFQLSLIEMASGAAFLWIVIAYLGPDRHPFTDISLGNNFLYMAILVLLCTTIPFALSFLTLRRLSVMTTTMALNLEPLYGIVLSILFLGEADELPTTFYYGVALILSVVALATWLDNRTK